MNTAWRRSHPVALVAALIDSVKDTVALILAMLAIALPNRDAPIVLTIIGVVIALLVACMLVFPVLRWLTTRYRLDENGVTQRSGMLNRKRTTISYDHIHAISSSSPIYMRPFQVVTLDITAAGGESGITLRGVPSSVQLELEVARQASGTPAGPAPAVAAGTRETGGQGWCAGPVPAAAAEDEVRVPDGHPIIEGELVFRASVRDILLFAVTDLGLFAALIVVYGFIEQLCDVVPEAMMDNAQDSVVRFATGSVVAFIGTVAVVFAVLVGASIIGSLLRFHGFEVWRRGGDLVVVRGAFTRRITTIAVDRIQTVAIRRTLIRRALHLCSVRLGLGAVATAEGEDADSTGADVLPVIGDDRVYAVLQRMLPEWELVPPRMRRTGRGLLRYYLFTPLAVSTIGMVGAAIWALASGDAMAWLWMLAPAALMVWWGLCRCLKAAAEGYMLPDGKRIVAAGATMLTLFTVFTRRSRIQSVERSTTPWRKRRGVESLTLPLFVSNGINTLRFTALRSADAATLAAWAEHGLVRADTSPGRCVDAAAGGMVDNGYVQDDEWRT